MANINDSKGRPITYGDTLEYFNPSTGHREIHKVITSKRYGGRLALKCELGKEIGFAEISTDGIPRQYGSKMRNKGPWKTSRWTIVHL